MKIMRNTAIVLALLLLSFAGLPAGETTSPTDVSVYAQTGDRVSTVSFTPERIQYPSESRTLPDANGLLPHDPAVSKSDSFGDARGLHAAFDGSMGSRTTGEFTASASYDAGRFTGTLRALTRSRTENTSSNLAPFSQRFEGSGYYDVAYGTYVVNAGMRRESESAHGEFPRNMGRQMDLVFGGISLETEPIRGWMLQGRVSFDGGTYRDPGNYSRSALDYFGDAELSGRVDDVDVTASMKMNYLKFGSEYGSLLSIAGAGRWLPFERLGVRAGAQITSSAMPSRVSKTRFYPELGIDWAIAPGSFFRLEWQPRIISHSFGDIYALNGLVTPRVPILYEDRKFDLSMEYGVLIFPRVHFTAELFGWASEHAPVFSRTGNLFEIIPDSRLTVSGIRLGTTVAKWGRWSGDGTVTFQNADWNHSGAVPYMPSFRLAANGRYDPGYQWGLYGSLRMEGKHHVEAGLDATAKTFMTVDIGAERELSMRSAVAYTELRNLLNSSGAWWTGDYRIPGIGLYAGLRARY